MIPSTEEMVTWRLGWHAKEGTATTWGLGGSQRLWWQSLLHWPHQPVHQLDWPQRQVGVIAACQETGDLWPLCPAGMLETRSEVEFKLTSPQILHLTGIDEWAFSVENLSTCPCGVTGRALLQGRKVSDILFGFHTEDFLHTSGCRSSFLSKNISKGASVTILLGSRKFICYQSQLKNKMFCIFNIFAW